MKVELRKKLALPPERIFESINFYTYTNIQLINKLVFGEPRVNREVAFELPK